MNIAFSYQMPYLYLQGVHWAALVVGYGLFGFGLVVASDIALSYVTDCYQEVSKACCEFEFPP